MTRNLPPLDCQQCLGHDHLMAARDDTESGRGEGSMPTYNSMEKCTTLPACQVHNMCSTHWCLTASRCCCLSITLMVPGALVQRPSSEARSQPQHVAKALCITGVGDEVTHAHEGIVGYGIADVVLRQQQGACALVQSKTSLIDANSRMGMRTMGGNG